ncbi:MAG: methyltransferase domain-containing protein, partial [Proteobacteria bacterium]|nr:methyltransferase domain-containing protein [Pseudomonadota bacterium]
MYSYDAVPYASDAFRQTHPDTLATMATLFGLRPAPTENCRVLELGCAAGGNIIPMAYAQRDCQFLGVDLSAGQIDEGKQTIRKLGLKNIELRQADIRQLDGQVGKFDYIITHGVYSWVPDDARTAIIRLYRHHLAPMGIGYISFNANPGWRMYGMIRQMMLYFSRNAKTPRDRIQRSRDLLTFLEESVPTDQAYSRLLGQALAGLSDQTDSYLFHEYLEDQNDPCYFRDFAYGAAAEGLAYLGESCLSSMLDRNFGPEIQKFLRARSSNIFELEQHMDFLRNRTFRQTLLCHAEVKLNRNLDTFDPTPYWIRSSARCLPQEPDLHSEAPMDFHLGEDLAITLTDPLAKAL